VFNPEKLDWFNQQHMARLSIEDLASRVEPWLRDAGLWSDDFAGGRRAWFHQVLEILKPRVKRMGQLVEDGRPFFADAVQYDQAAVRKHLTSDLRGAFEAWSRVLRDAEPFEPAALEATMRAFAESRSVKFGALVHATRVALTGRARARTVRGDRACGPRARRPPDGRCGRTVRVNAAVAGPRVRARGLRGLRRRAVPGAVSRSCARAWSDPAAGRTSPTR